MWSRNPFLPVTSIKKPDDPDLRGFALCGQSDLHDRPAVKISLSATNPCHIWDMARALAATDDLRYLLQRLPALATAGGEKACPSAPSRRARWSSTGRGGFSPRACAPETGTSSVGRTGPSTSGVAKALEAADFVHGLPGQCRETFRRARELGIRTVLSHATGPRPRAGADRRPRVRAGRARVRARDPVRRRLLRPRGGGV